MSQSTIRLLILNDSRSEAERLISMLHNAGRSVRAQHVESDEALTKLLQEKPWDLMVALNSSEKITPLDAIKQIRRLNKDIPLVLQADIDEGQACVAGLKMGARDVVELDDDQHLLLVIERELENLQERYSRRIAERQLNEISRRNQQLLDSSRDAIAFVQDGMFLYVNDSFAELLVYESKDDLECLPVIDIIDESEHDALKVFLKDFTFKSDDLEQANLSTTALNEDGTPRRLKIEVSKANYDDEACIQFLIKTRTADAEELEAQLEEIKNLDVATGLFNKNYLFESVERFIGKAADQEYNSAVLKIGIDKFQETVNEKIGVGSSDKVLAEIANHAKSLTKKTDALCRYTDDTLILLIENINGIRAQERAEEIGKSLRKNVVDVDGKTLQFNYHIGIAIVNEITTRVDTPIDHSIKALELARKEAENDPAVIAKIYEPELPKDDKRSIERAVQDALDNNKFKLLFQPILSLRGSDKEHYEVLLRMIGDKGEEISPDEFLSAAATIGSTTRIDRWVILESIKILAGHRKNGSDTRLIVHLSRESLLDATLAPWLSVAFKAAGLQKESVIFQLNEVDVNDHLNVAIGFTKAVTSMGCCIGISRFGCALNPFNALSQLDVNYVKVDGSFTQDLTKDEDGARALNELVSELHQSDKITIVPFVESAAVLSKLWQSGVHYIQGYYLQGPTDSMNYDFDMES